MFQAHFGYLFLPGGVSELVLPKLARKIKNKKNLYQDIYENVLRELGTLLLPSLKTLSLFKELLHHKILSQLQFFYYNKAMTILKTWKKRE